MGAQGGIGKLLLWLLVALLTMDKMANVQSLYCVSTPLASIKVRMHTNNFFTLSSLYPSPAEASYATKLHNRNLVVTSYSGKV